MKYSIITPIYNRADCIGRCIESVIRSLSPELSFEHIIVDDGSTDGTSEIIERYVREYSHIKFIKFEHNKGTNAARNAAIISATGDFCIILDSDDYFVDDAIKKIDTVIAANPQYIHFLFVPDDRVDYMNNNALLEGKKNMVLTFTDFLSDKVTGDFVHVLKTTTLRKYPFDEGLRIFEGVFFLQFYKEAQQMLFVNEIITIRERNRNDSVSKDFIRTSVDKIQRKIKSITLWLSWFEKDCYKLGLLNLVRDKYIRLLENHLLLNDYHSAENDIKQIEQNHWHFPLYLKIIYSFRLGTFFRQILIVYLRHKYEV